MSILISKREVIVFFPLHVFGEWISVSFEEKASLLYLQFIKTKLWGFSIPHPKLPYAKQFQFTSLIYLFGGTYKFSFEN